MPRARGRAGCDRDGDAGADPRDDRGALPGRRAIPRAAPRGRPARSGRRGARPVGAGREGHVPERRGARPARRLKPMNGWRVFGLLAALETALFATGLAAFGSDEAGLRALVRSTVRVSFVVFA